MTVLQVTHDSEREKYQRYLCSREWGVLREQVNQRCAGVCERCHHFPMSHVHHLTYIRKYRELATDLQGLCIGCHEFTHGKRDRDPIHDIRVVFGGREINNIYLAGRMDKGDDWRSEIVPGWKLGGCSGALRAAIPDRPSIRLIGPRWVDMGHNGPSGTGPHASGDDLSWNHGTLCASRIEDPRAVLRLRLDELCGADLCFAWLGSRECYGTLAEIGYFHRGGSILVVAAPRWDRELWFACAMANRFITAPRAIEAWWKLWSGKANSLGDVSDCFES